MNQKNVLRKKINMVSFGLTKELGVEWFLTKIIRFYLQRVIFDTEF